MFYYISGTLAYRESGFAVLDCGGGGYRLTVSQNTMAALDTLQGKSVKLYTHMAVREDNIELFGFFSEDELHTFRLLTGVSGIGPKAAMGVLSAFTPDGLARAVSGEDVKAISKANGVGAKSAARIVLELKDKLSFGASDSTVAVTKNASAASNGSGAMHEAAEALAALGYGRSEINAALAKINVSEMESGEIIRAALAQFMKG